MPASTYLWVWKSLFTGVPLLFSALGNSSSTVRMIDVKIPFLVQYLKSVKPTWESITFSLRAYYKPLEGLFYLSRWSNSTQPRFWESQSYKNTWRRLTSIDAPSNLCWITVNYCCQMSNLNEKVLQKMWTSHHWVYFGPALSAIFDQ